MRTPVAQFIASTMCDWRKDVTKAYKDVTKACRAIVLAYVDSKMPVVDFGLVDALRTAVGEPFVSKVKGSFTEHDTSEFAIKVFNYLHTSCAVPVAEIVPCAGPVSFASIENAAICAIAALTEYKLPDGVSALSAYFSFILGNNKRCTSPVSVDIWKFERHFILECKNPNYANTTLQGLFDMTFADGKFPGDYKLDDMGTKCATGTDKSVMCSKPPYLWVKTNRNKFDEAIKTQKKENFKVALDASLSVSIRIHTAGDDTFEPQQYNLIGCCVHTGDDYKSGHWVAYTNVGGQWYLFDDSTVTSQNSLTWFQDVSIWKNISFMLLQRDGDVTAGDGSIT
jgi:hypothetical protein